VALAETFNANLAFSLKEMEKDADPCPTFMLMHQDTDDDLPDM
jgi:hypothetical protein